MGYLKNEDRAVTEKVIPVKLKRGEQVEYGRLVYRGYVRLREEETGEASKLFHPIDDRQCNWQVSAHMDRQYFVASIMGVEDPMPASTVNIKLTINGASNGLASILDHDPCSDCQAKIKKDVDSLTAELVAVFDAKMNEDIELFKAERTGITVTINPDEEDAKSFFGLANERINRVWKVSLH